MSIVKSIRCRCIDLPWSRKKIGSGAFKLSSMWITVRMVTRDGKCQRESEGKSGQSIADDYHVTLTIETVM